MIVSYANNLINNLVYLRLPLIYAWGGVELSRNPLEAPTPFSSVMPIRSKTVVENPLVYTFASDLKLSDVLSVTEIMFVSNKLE